MTKMIKTYITAIVTALAVGLLSALLTMNNMSIYNDIAKPEIAPPAILFPIVWTVLYILMGISSAMIYSSSASEKDKRDSLLIYAIQLAVNFFWSIIFFNQRAFLFSFVWLVLLWILIVIMIINFSKINKTSAYLQIPYLLWVSFAGYLNLSIFLLN